MMGIEAPELTIRESEKVFNGHKAKNFSREKFGELAQKEILGNYKELLDGMNSILVTLETDIQKTQSQIEELLEKIWLFHDPENKGILKKIEAKQAYNDFIREMQINVSTEQL